MAKPLKPLINSGGFFPTAKLTPLVLGNGFTTQNGDKSSPWREIAYLVTKDDEQITTKDNEYLTIFLT